MVKDTNKIPEITPIASNHTKKNKQGKKACPQEAEVEKIQILSQIKGLIKITAKWHIKINLVWLILSHLIEGYSREIDLFKIMMGKVRGGNIRRIIDNLGVREMSLRIDNKIKINVVWIVDMVIEICKIIKQILKMMVTVIGITLEKEDAVVVVAQVVKTQLNNNKIRKIKRQLLQNTK